MSFSPLTTKIIPASTSNYSKGRSGQTIKKITWHHMAGNCSIETCGKFWQDPSRRASSNYGIGTDGRIGGYVDEENRSWCSSSAANDNQAITIEIANDGGAPDWHVSDTAIESAIRLTVDICQRRGIKQLSWTGNANGTFTWHCMFTSTACVPLDTELLTKDGWKRIADIAVDEEVASAHIDDLTINFSPVLAKVPVKTQDTWTVRGIEATADHRMLCRGQGQKDWKCGQFCQLWGLNRQIYIPNAGYYTGKGLPLTNAEIEYLIAVQADGHYMKDGGYYGIEFHLKKQRKVDSICDLLDDMGYEYKLGDRSDGSKVIRIYGKDKVEYAEKWLNNKQFTWAWLELSPEQAAFFLDKILDYDGCRAGGDYSSSVRQNIDVVDAIAAINGVGIRHSAEGKRTHFTASTRSITTESERTRHQKQQVTCVTVPEGFILVRQNGRTTIIGNCPGPYLKDKTPWAVNEINKRLAGGDKPDLTWTKLDKTETWATNCQPTCLWDFNHTTMDACQSIKRYDKGEEIEIYGKVANKQLGTTYLLTEYSFTNKITNGFNTWDMVEKPEPTPPEPTPEWADVEVKKYVTAKATSLYDVKTGYPVKDYAAGEEVEIAQECTFNDTKWGRTQYSKDKGIDNGFKMDDLKEPEPGPTPDPTVGILQKIIQFIQHIIDLITGKNK